MTPDTLAAALRARDVALNPGRPDFGADGLAALGVGPLHAGFAIVRCFDGFAHMDAGHVRMWDLATILAEQHGSPKPQGMIAFGDVLIFSEIILCDPCDPSRPVVQAFEARELAPTYAVFWERLVAGELSRPAP